MKSYLVGGAVRDKILQLPIIERDWVVVGSTIQEMLDAGFQSVGNDFPVFLHPKSKEEYALARTERKSGKGYTGFTCISDPSITLEEDLYRRDLTINAIAMNHDETLIDPYSGISDIQHKILRHVSAAFTEDPLRVLRVARFAAKFHNLGFTIADETMALMQSMTQQGELEHLVAERVWKETEKALMSDSPQIFFSVLRQCGALKVLFPEVDALFGVPQTATHHPEIDTGIHTLMVVEQSAKLSTAIVVRFAALTHDLGKGITPAAEWPRHIQHENRGKAIVKKMCARLRVPNTITDLAILVCEQHLNCHRALELKPATVQKLFKSLDLYRRPERLELFLLACKADARGRLGFENREYPQSDYLQQCFSAAVLVGSHSINTQNLSGSDIGKAIDDERIKAIHKIRTEFKRPEILF